MGIFQNCEFIMHSSDLIEFNWVHISHFWVAISQFPFSHMSLYLKIICFPLRILSFTILSFYFWKLRGTYVVDEKTCLYHIMCISFKI